LKVDDLKNDEVGLFKCAFVLLVKIKDMKLDYFRYFFLRFKTEGRCWLKNIHKPTLKIFSSDMIWMFVDCTSNE
jgi:hypothetical protein